MLKSELIHIIKEVIAEERLLESDNINIKSIESKDIPEILDLNYKIFKHEISWNESELKAYLKESTDWSISKKAVDSNGKIIGFYLFNNDN